MSVETLAPVGSAPDRYITLELPIGTVEDLRAVASGHRIEDLSRTRLLAKLDRAIADYYEPEPEQVHRSCTCGDPGANDFRHHFDGRPCVSLFGVDV